MTVEGVVMSGQVIASVPGSWPEGSRVSVALVDEDDILDAELASCPPPPETETHEEFLESLRQEIADIKAGIRGIPLEQLERELAAEFKLPLIPKD